MFSTAEAILCGNYTPLGQVQIGPIDSLGGQLAEYQIPSGIISTLKLADLAVTVDKLGISSVNDSKVAAGAEIVESKLSLDFGTDALNDLISANDIDIASNLALVLLREEFANKDVANGYLGLDAGAKVPLAKLNPLTNSEIDASAEIVESKLNLAFGTSALNTDIQTREESANKDQASGYLGLDASAKVPLSKLNPLTNTQIAVAAAIIESKLNLAFGTSALNTDIQTRQLSNEKGVANGYCDLDAAIHVPLSRLSNLSNAQIAAAAAIIESKLSLAYSTTSLNTAILLRELASNKGIANGYCDLDAAIHVPLNRLSNLTNTQIAAAAAIAESKLNLNYPTHPQSHNVASHSDVTISGAQVEDITGFGSATATWVMCNFDGWSGSRPGCGAVGYRNEGITPNTAWQFTCPLPPIRGNLKLYVDGVRVGILDADAGDYVDRIRVMGVKVAAPGFVAVYDCEINMTSAGYWTSNDNLDAWDEPVNMAVYDGVRIFLLLSLTTQYDLDIQFVSVHCYYGP